MQLCSTYPIDTVAMPSTKRSTEQVFCHSIQIETRIITSSNIIFSLLWVSYYQIYEANLRINCCKLSSLNVVVRRFSEQTEQQLSLGIFSYEFANRICWAVYCQVRVLSHRYELWNLKCTTYKMMYIFFVLSMFKVFKIPLYTEPSC